VGSGCVDWIELAQIGIGGLRLWVRWWTFGFHKLREISWLAADQLASQDSAPLSK
jgi:hypothetical protein